MASNDFSVEAIGLAFAALFVAWCMLMVGAFINGETPQASKWRWLSSALIFWGLSLVFVVCLKLTVALIVN